MRKALAATMLLPTLLLALALAMAVATATPAEAYPVTAATCRGYMQANCPVPVLMYNYGRMERTARIHMDPDASPGDYVPGFYTQPWRTHIKYDNPIYQTRRLCLTAVNWQHRDLVRRNALIRVRFPDGGVELCQPADWQRRGDATSYQRLEVDGYTAQKHGFYGRTTTATIVGYILR